MKFHKAFMAVLAAGTILAAGIAHAQSPQFFRIGTGGAGGTYFPIGGTIANAISAPPGARACDDGGQCGIISETQVRSVRPAKLDDELQVTAMLREAGRASLHIAQQAWRGAELLAEGDIRIGCVDATTLRPRRLPDPLIRALAPAPA